MDRLWRTIDWKATGHDNPVEGRRAGLLLSPRVIISALDAKGGLQMSLRPIVRRQLVAGRAYLFAVEAGRRFESWTLPASCGTVWYSWVLLHS